MLEEGSENAVNRLKNPGRDSVLITPKALANFSPGFERSEYPGIRIKIEIQTLKGFAPERTLSGFRFPSESDPRVVATLPTLG